MADDLDDGEFWLPSHFLTEEDILIDFDTSTTLSSSGFNSDLGSPVDSVTETESDEDDFLPSLTLHLSRSSLLPLSTPNPNPNPKFTPPPPAKKGTGYFDSSRGLGKQSTPVSPPKTPNFHGPKSQVIVPQFQAVWNQQMMKQQRLPPPLMSSSAWPTVQRAANRRQPTPAVAATQMRAVFLGPPGPKRESVGTGVFLPRNVNPTEPRKKSNKHGSATVLVPEKVVQALKNINLDSTKKVQGHNNGINGAKRNGENKAGGSVEIQLPSEWTY